MDLDQLKINDYLTTYNIEENTPDYNYLVIYLNFIFSYLGSKGLIFSTGQSQVIQRYAVNTRQTIFPVPLFSNLTKVSYFEDDTEEVLVLLTDYIQKDYKSGYFKSIELLDTNKVFYFKSHLELTGIFGFDIIPDDLHLVFLDIFSELLNQSKSNLSKLENDGKELSSIRAGNINYSFRGYSKIISQPTFSKIFLKMKL